MRARALAFTSPRRVELVEVDVTPPGPDGILVRSEFSGISGGTEILAYRGEIDPELALDETISALTGRFEYPFIYGYSSVGLVEQSGGGFDEGDRVFAFHPHQEVFSCTAEDAVKLSEFMAPRVATLLPLVETAFQVTLDVAPRLGETVVVIGQGAVGILAAVLLMKSGARVFGVDVIDGRRTVAASLNVPQIDPQDLRDKIYGLTGGKGADYVVEASGDPSQIGTALEILRQEGEVIVCSWYGMKTATLSLGREFHRRRLVIRSTQVSTIPSSQSRKWTRRRRLLAALKEMQDLSMESIASHEFPFEDAAAAFASLDESNGQIIHAALRY